MREIEEISVIHSGCSRLTGTTIDNIPKLLFGTNLIYYLRLRECYSTPPSYRVSILKKILGGANETKGNFDKF